MLLQLVFTLKKSLVLDYGLDHTFLPHEVFPPFPLIISFSQVLLDRTSHFIPDANLVEDNYPHNQINEQIANLIPDLDIQDKFCEAKDEIGCKNDKTFV